MRKFDWKYFMFAIILITGFILFRLNYIAVMNSIQWFLSLPNLSLYFGSIATIFTLLGKFKSGKIAFNSRISFVDFRASISDIVSFVDNPIVIVGSLGLAKGLFLYYLGNVKYFPFLNSYEIILVLLVTLYLLYISLLELWNNIIKTFSKDIISKDIPHATLQGEVKGKEVPKPEH